MRRRYLFEIDGKPYSRHRLRRKCADDRAINRRVLVEQNGDGPISFGFDGVAVVAYPYTKQRPRGRCPAENLYV